MAAPPCACASTFGAAAIAVAATPVASMSRRVESIIVASRYYLCLRRFSDLVLRLRLEIAGVMALMQLARRIALDTVDHAAALHGRTLGELVGPALHVLVFVHSEKFARTV